MASATVPATITFYIRKKTGANAGLMKKVYQNQTAALAAGGCPDGVPAAKPSDWLSVPAMRGIKANPDDELVITLTTVSAVTLDASDAVWSIPMTLDSGLTTLGNNSSDFDVLALADTAYVAGQETVAAVHKFKEGGFFGGGKIFVAVENNA